MRISTLSWLKLFVLYTMLAHSTENRKKAGLMDKHVYNKRMYEMLYDSNKFEEVETKPGTEI